MPKLSWLVLPVTLVCWFHAWRLYVDSNSSLFGQLPQTNGKHYLPSALPSKRTVVSPADDPLRITDKPENVFFFVQVSDLHVSLFRRMYLEHFNHFLGITLPSIDPEFVLVTGDLTDAKDKWKISSSQLKEEWQMYHDALKTHGILDKPDFWWDQRGNHDCFDVPDWSSPHNYFRDFSRVRDHHYGFQFKRDFGSYNFVGLDACPIHGPSRPFNFFGYFDRNDMDMFQMHLEKFGQHSNHTFLLNHYPLGMVMTGLTSTGLDFDTLSQHVSVLMCGHLHKLAAGIGELLHVRHPLNFMELELSDMKAHGSFRIMAIDHDLISFVDTSIMNTGERDAGKPYFHSDPFVLITNPKDARYIMNDREPSHRIASSTHIRVLVFSKSEISRVSVFINDQLLSQQAAKEGPMENSKVPLWTIKWDPSDYVLEKRYTMKVIAIDQDGNQGEHVITFRGDGKPLELESGFGKMIMTPKYHYWFKIFFLAAYLTIVIALLLIPKIYSLYLHRTRRYHRWRLQYSKLLIELDTPQMITIPKGGLIDRLKYRMFLTWLAVDRDFKYFAHASVFRLVTLASLATTFYPMLFYALYITVGPFFIGELIPSSLDNGRIEGLGMFYLYGVYVEHHWVPLPDTWVFGLFELVYVLAPLIIFLSFCITPPEQLYSIQVKRANLKPNAIFWLPPIHNRRKYPLHRRMGVRATVAFAAWYQLVNCFFIGLYYGPIAALLSPGKTWFVLWACYALYKHRWSARGREIDLMEDDGERRPFLWFLGGRFRTKSADVRIKPMGKLS